jgi:hypothetical protein
LAEAFAAGVECFTAAVERGFEEVERVFTGGGASTGIARGVEGTVRAAAAGTTTGATDAPERRRSR